MLPIRHVLSTLLRVLGCTHQSMPCCRPAVIPPEQPTHRRAPLQTPRCIPRLTREAWARPQATQEVISRLPETTGEEFEAAVSAAKNAFPAWRQTPVPTRARAMLKLQQLIRENMVRRGRPRAARCCQNHRLTHTCACSCSLLRRGRHHSAEAATHEPCVHHKPPSTRQDELARNVTLEQGKTLGDARGDVFRGLGATHLLISND